MTTLREAAQQALEALESLEVRCTDLETVTAWYPEAIDTLREALAQPEPEPVAWMYEWDGKRHLTFTDQRFIEKSHPHFNKSSPLYTHPPQRQPLTVEEILKIWNDMGNDPIAPSVFSFIACVRKTEQAHGIGGEE